MKKLSVIIVSYNNYDILKECIESIILFNDIGDQLETIVSDNSPNDYIVNELQRDYPDVKSIYNNNIGFGAGNNKGFEISNGEYLLFLNPDTILIEPIFRFAIDKFDNNEKLSLFGVKLLNKQLKRNDSFFLMDNNSIMANALFKFFYFWDLYIDNKMYISGANIFVRKSDFIKAGFFDENIFMYYEEPDLIKRIKMNSNRGKIAYYKEKKIIHLEGGTEKKDIKTIKTKIERNMVTYKYYCKKWGIDFNKNVNEIIRYQELKRIIYKIFKDKDNIKLIDELILMYKKYLREQNEEQKGKVI